MKFALDMLRYTTSQKYFFIPHSISIQKYILQYQNGLRRFCCQSVNVLDHSPALLKLEEHEDSLNSNSAHNKIRKKQTRIKFKEYQLEKLENAFRNLSYPDVLAYEDLALKLNLSEAQVKIWFKNRRAKWRKNEASREDIIQIIPPSNSEASDTSSIVDLPIAGIKDIKQERIKHLHNILNKLNFDSEQILKQPRVLALGPRNIEERYYGLLEFGFTDITISKILSYNSLMAVNISKLVEQKMLSSDIKPLENLVSQIDAPPDFLKSLQSKYPAIDEASLFLIKSVVFKEYVTWFFKLSSSEILSFLDQHPSIKYRSLTNIFLMWNILLYEFGYSLLKIRTSKCLLLMDPLNLKRVLSELTEIAGLSIHDFIKKHPRIMLWNSDNVKEIDKILHENGITNKQILKCPNIYSVDSETVKKRLKDFQKFEEFNIFKYHPRFLHLIEHYNRSKERMHYLKSVGYAQISINLLTASNRNFKKWCSTINMHFTPKECIQMLANIFGRSFQEISFQLKQHPKSLGLNLNNVKTIKILKEHGFSEQQIYCALPLILYEPCTIKEQLNSLQSIAEIQPYNEWVSRTDALHIIIYLIERSYGFTWEGVQSARIKKVRQEFIFESFEPNLLLGTDDNINGFCANNEDNIIKLAN